MQKNAKIITIAVAVVSAAAMAGAFAFVGSKSPAVVPPGNSPAGDSGLKLVQTIPLAGVKGRIDHMAVDVKNQRLFVAAFGNNSVEVIDLKSGKDILSITGLQEPQGVLFVPEYDQLYISNGGDGTVRIFDANSFELVRSPKFSGDADNLRYDSFAKVVYVGYGEGGLGLINATSGSTIGTIPLGSHPESFQLATAKGRADRIYANIPQSQSIAVIDGLDRATASKWALKDGRANFPMALDEDNHLLYVGLRDPSRIDVYDTATGSVISIVDIAQDPDDIFVDTSSGKVYISCGEGFVDVIGGSKGHFAIVDHVPTASGARTSLFVPAQNRLYVAAPEYASRPAQIMVFDVQSPAG